MSPVSQAPKAVARTLVSCLWLIASLLVFLLQVELVEQLLQLLLDSAKTAALAPAIELDTFEVHMSF